jgi:membrane associated rhomboid family serine protease
MLPIGDENPYRKRFPLVTYALLLVNILIFYFEVRGGEAFITTWSFVPARFFANPVGDLASLFTSMFLHASLIHLGSNMLYLLIFGDNVESFFGHFKFLVFYLVSGLAGNLAQGFFSANSTVPMLGASGAIAGVLGAYILLFPTRKVRVLLGFFVLRVSALVAIGAWFILQLLNGYGSVAVTAESGGVAYLAHVGGFVMGFLLTAIFRKKI